MPSLMSRFLSVKPSSLTFIQTDSAMISETIDAYLNSQPIHFLRKKYVDENNKTVNKNLAKINSIPLEIKLVGRYRSNGFDSWPYMDI